MIEVVSFRCPTCETSLQSSGFEGNGIVLCPSCGTAAKVPVTYQYAATRDQDHPEAPVIFVKPSSVIRRQSRRAKLVSEAKSAVKFLLILSCLGGGIWLIWFSFVKGSSKLPASNLSETTGEGNGFTPRPIMKLNAAASQESTARQAASIEGLKAATNVPSTMAVTSAATNPNDGVSATKTAIDQDRLALEALRKEREELANKQMLMQERARLELEISQLKEATTVKPVVATAAPTSEELHTQMKRTNGELAFAQRSLNMQQDELATLQNLNKITTKQLNGDIHDPERRTSLYKSRSRNLARIRELEKSIPELEQSTKDLSAKLKLLKEQSLGLSDAKPAKVADSKTAP